MVIRDGNSVGSSLVVALRPPFKRLNGSFRRGTSSRFARRPASLLAPPDVVPQCEENGVPKSNSPDGPAGWAVSFERLLDDHLGLHKFAEFLKKEFSAENIYFWAACERFRRLPSGPERNREAQRIYKQHLCKGAPEPVNVDSQGRQCTEQLLEEADASLFEKAQKQIFNLMKFDCYPRFLKSDLYKECLAGNFTGPQIDAGLMIYPVTSTSNKLKKSLSNAEDRRRKSLLPWHRKNRSKSKDRGESEYNSSKKNDVISNDVGNQTGRNAANDVYSSKSSLTSIDFNQDSTKINQEDKKDLCKVILNNGSTTVVQTKESETIQQLVNRVLNKRGITYGLYEVYVGTNRKLDLNESSLSIGGCEITVEQRAHFKLDLPNGKIISVKSKYTKQISSVLCPILHKFGYDIKQVKVTLGNDNVDFNLGVCAIDGARLLVQMLEGFENQAAGSKASNCKEAMDEITNKVYRDIIHGKSETTEHKPVSDKTSVKSEDWGSENSSIFGRFLRRDSAMHDRKKKTFLPRSKGNSIHSSVEDITAETNTKKPLIAKWKSGVKLHITSSENDELYEGLSRAVRSRLEDQRGTEINFELPDFLKDKEGGQLTNNNTRKIRLTDESNAVENRRLFPAADVVLHPKQERSTPPISSAKNFKLEQQSNYENRAISSNSEKPTNTNNLPTCSPKKSPPENSKLSQTKSPFENNNTPECTSINLSQTSINDAHNCSKVGDPPPLPPKPKILPIRPSNWGQNAHTKPGLYLEHPTSSFV